MLLSAEGVFLTIWMAVFTIVITIVIALRLVAARIKKRALRPDDFLIIIAYVSTLALEGTTWWAIANGLGAHTSELTQYEVGVQYQILLGTGIAWLVATVCCKLSILWFYTCIFTTKRFKLAARILMFIAAGYGISFFFMFLTNCRPVSHSWAPKPGGHCKSVTVEEITSVSVNMVIDTLIVILPMRPLWKLQMATRKKIGLSILFGLGILVVGIMGWRIEITVDSTTKTDFVYGLGNIGLVTHLEVWIGITVACMPTLVPFYSKYIVPLVSKLSKASTELPGRRQLKEAQHSIGSWRQGGLRKKNFKALDSIDLLELEDGRTSGKTETLVNCPATCEEEQGRWVDTNTIGVRRDVEVLSTPHRA